MGLPELDSELRKAGIAIERNVPLAPYTTFRIGGPADLLAVIQTTEEAAAAFRLAKQEGISVYVLGKGSNLLVADAGVRGLIITLGEGLSGMTVDGCRVTAGAGVSLAALCRKAQADGLTGLEFAYGIPGTLGGAVLMNAGAYGGEMKDVVSQVTYLEDGEEKTRPAADCGFAYRHSFFSDRPALITGATLQLREGDRTEIQARMDDLMARRQKKQPLQYPSAGSTFKRPPGAFAAALIEACGLKGARCGGAMVSEKHSGFVVNAGDATAGEVEDLIRLVRETVYRQSGILLECEIKRWG